MFQFSNDNGVCAYYSIGDAFDFLPMNKSSKQRLNEFVRSDSSTLNLNGQRLFIAVYEICFWFRVY